MLTTIHYQALFALCVGATPCLGALANGDFSAGLGTEWNPAGNVAVQVARPGTPVANPYAILREENSNGLSRIHQTFTSAVPTTVISFRFLFSASGATEVGPMPPDSFSVFLLDSGGAPILTAGPGAPSNFKGLLYFDSKGETFHNPDVVTLMAPDADGFLTATVRLTAIPPNTPIRIEFGLATARNGTASEVLVDTVTLGCMRTPYFNIVDGEIAYLVYDPELTNSTPHYLTALPDWATGTPAATLVSNLELDFEGTATTKVYYRNKLDKSQGLAFTYRVALAPPPFEVNIQSAITWDARGWWDGVTVSAVGADGTGLSTRTLANGTVVTWNGNPSNFLREPDPNDPTSDQAPRIEFYAPGWGHSKIKPGGSTATVFFTTNAQEWQTSAFAFIGAGKVGRAEVLVPYGGCPIRPANP